MKNLTKIVNEINGIEKEIHLEDLLLALQNRGIKFEIIDSGKMIVSKNSGNHLLIFELKIEFFKPLLKQKQEVNKKLIEILS